jgi:hypothetical protein
MDKISAIGLKSISIHDAKASWDKGNEICTKFFSPWILDEGFISLTDNIPQRLDLLNQIESIEESRIQKLYAELNDEVYNLYGIPNQTRTIIEETLGQRPTEVLWPQMERKAIEQKRMEHVWRLLSYVVKRVVEFDEDGIVPLTAINGEQSLIDLVRKKLADLLPGHDINRIEVEIANELRRKVKGYRGANSIEQWLEDVYFDFHASLYKKRPIFWHIASSQGRSMAAFSALVHYHKFDKDRMAKLRSVSLRQAIRMFRREAGLASQEGRSEDRQEWQAKLEETEALDQKLQWVQEGFFEGEEGGDRDFRVLTPWKTARQRPQGWDPDLDDGVAVNLAPLQHAGVLRLAKVV